MKESSPSCICVQSSCVPTEVDYSTKVDQKPTQCELKTLINAGKRRFWNNREKQILKAETNGKNIIHLKIVTYCEQIREKDSTIESQENW